MKTRFSLIFALLLVITGCSIPSAITQRSPILSSSGKPEIKIRGDKFAVAQSVAVSLYEIDFAVERIGNDSIIIGSYSDDDGRSNELIWHYLTLAEDSSIIVRIEHTVNGSSVVAEISERDQYRLEKVKNRIDEGELMTISQPNTPSSGSTVAPTNSTGDVHVKGYYRKDGTYVRPHTRSRPGSKKGK